MDDYSKYYYQRIGGDKGDFGDISERTKLRNDLKCKTFQWYLDTIFPELFIPGDAVAQGEVRFLELGFDGVFNLVLTLELEDLFSKIHSQII